MPARYSMKKTRNRQGTNLIQDENFDEEDETESFSAMMFSIWLNYLPEYASTVCQKNLSTYEIETGVTIGDLLFGPNHVLHQWISATVYAGFSKVSVAETLELFDELAASARGCSRSETLTM